MRRFGVKTSEFVTETGHALVWKVRTGSDDPAALKLFKSGHMGNERPGIAYATAKVDAPIARILDHSDDAQLTEWLDGPSLGELVRDGRDVDAAEHVMRVAVALHQDCGSLDGLARLDSWVAGLLDAEILVSSGPDARRAFGRAKDIAASLMADPQDQSALHGDLHHDNIRLSDRGWLAFDAKGVWGERCYELANAFRNPKGVPDLVRDPARIRYLADLWSQGFGVDRKRLLDWAAVKCALSIVWRAKGPVGEDAEFDVLDRLLAVAGEN